MALKWGIVSAGKISHDFVNALGTLNQDDHQVVAVAAACDVSRAKEFAQRFNIPKAYGSYLELAKDPNVEVAYIGTLNPQHYEVSRLMLDHGKHVLCEKPLCMNEKQARKLIEYARQKNLFLMEAIWSRFFPAYQYIRQQINSGALGEITRVEAEHGLGFLDKLERLQKKKLGGGTVLDLGVYVIQCCQWAFQQPPKTIHASGIMNEDDVDIKMLAELHYGDHKVAKIKTSALRQLENKAKIIGTKGQITLFDFWAPTTIIDVDGAEKTWPLPKAKTEFNFHNSCGLRYEADEVRKCIRAGKIECDIVSHEESLMIARIEDEIRKQLSVIYPEDD